MKKIAALIFICVGATSVFSQTLFTYGPYPVGKDEFLRAYNKNKTPVTDKEKSLREYLDLYAKFKLKVKVARDQRLDTLQQMNFDLQNFRSQVAEGYMNDEKELNALVEEAATRSQKDIHVMHFYADINSKMTAADTIKVYAAMSELAGKLKDDKTGYAGIVEDVSKKYVVVNAKDLGYITVLTVPYEIENLVYNLKPGEISKLYRTRSALHLFKNLDERKSAGKWKIAQILLSVPPNASGDELKVIETRADSIYKVLMAGADFSEIAKEFSEDRLTYLNGGEMPEFGTGKYELPFETSVFQLKKDGDISKPIFTGYGYHIVKRLQQQDLPEKNDGAFVFALKQQISQDSRVNGAKADFLKSVKIKTGYKKNALVKDADLFRYADSVTANNQVGNYPINNKTVFSFAGQQVKGADWLNFVKDYKLNADVYQGENNKDLLDKYIATASFEYYRKHLEEYNNDFKYQVQEFKEGNMLFEIMEKNVWSKATNDSAGLVKYYNEHQANYKWAPSASILLFNCSDVKVAQEAASALRNGKNWKQIADESDGKLQADSGRYELNQIQLPPGTKITEGLISTPYTANGENTTGFVKVLRMFPENQPRSYDEAKGLVINDYQGLLEQKWVEELKKKYPIKLNEVVFQSLLK